jgi:poly-beta-1,6-N-acetyl-D-glucosamine synthase
VTIVLFLSLFLYALLLSWLALGFIRSKTFSAANDPSLNPVTIIICARNEEQNIVSCLKSILAQDYDPDKIQILLINDASTDKTRSLGEKILAESKINHAVISNIKRRGKKQSITDVMSLVQNELIVTRDADTVTHSPKWLRTISGFYSATTSDLIIAPIAFIERPRLLWALQAIENNVLTVITAGSAFYNRAFLANGANLVFTRSIFQKTNGYSSHMSIDSGDDVLFLEDVKKIPGRKIGYLKSQDAIVHTYATETLRSLFNQKIRWAGKFKQNSNVLNFGMAFLIFLVNALFIVCAVQMSITKAGGQEHFLFIVLKLCIDFLLLFLASTFIKNKYLTWFILPVALIYPLYACLVSFFSVFLKPSWKT